MPIPDAVEDLVQEVFISVWEGKRTFSDIKELTNYLYRACYNNTLLYIRNNQIHDSILSSLAEECRQDEDMIYALTVKEEIIRQLYFHIEELPPEQRRIILLRIEGYTWEEIAERLEISINTVKTQKSRSYKFLREKLGDSIHHSATAHTLSLSPGIPPIVFQALSVLLHSLLPKETFSLKQHLDIYFRTYSSYYLFFN